MGKISNLLSKGMSENDKKELQQALTQLNHLNAKLTAKYTLANDLEHIKDGRTAAAKLIKSEIEQLRASINEVVQLKTELKLEIQNILSLKQKIDNFKNKIEEFLRAGGSKSPEDIFGDIFGGGRSGRARSGPSRGANIKTSVRITFEEAVFGCEKEIEIKLQDEDNRVKISVFNTGTPIPEADVPNLWNKFYKVDKARTREYGGSGIGLSIVKAIMESMNQEYEIGRAHV